MLKQGPGPKGIFGAGVILEAARLADAGNGKQAMMAPVRFYRFVDPKKELLIDEDTVRELLELSQIQAQASGYPLRGDQPELLEALVPTSAPSAHLPRAGESDEEQFDPASVEDARQRTKRTILQRRGQRAFREALLAAYDRKCSITGCPVQDVLEAAHIYPYRGLDTNKVTNGLLLRADLHTLFDCGLIAVDPAEKKVLVAPALRASEYAKLHGRALRSTSSPSQAPSRKALALHRKVCRF